MFKTTGFAEEGASMMEMGGWAAGVNKGKVLHVPVWNGLRAAQIQADQDLADPWLMWCQLKSHQHQRVWKGGHWLMEWSTHQRLEVTAEMSGETTED